MAANTIGTRNRSIIIRHILPNILPIVIVQVTLSMSWAVLTAAALSYLGLGTPPPTPALGSMVFELGPPPRRGGSRTCLRSC